jgi:flagellar hook-length control protein FliK
VHANAPETTAAATTLAAAATVTSVSSTTPSSGSSSGSNGRPGAPTPSAPLAALGATTQPGQARATFATVAAAATAAPSAPQPTNPAEQVLGALLPLHNRPDGTYTMQLELHPHDLGRVQLTVELHKGVLSVHMQADTPEARAAIAAHLDHLRNLLDGQGVQTGRLDLAGHSGSNLSDAFRAGADARNGDGDGDGNARTGGRGTATQATEQTTRAAAPATTRPTTDDRRLDLQI